MATEKRILVAGSTNGKLAQLFARVEKIIKATGAFDVLFLTGSLLEDGTELEPFKSGERKVPLPTYFICTEKDRSALSLKNASPGTVICPNLIYLGEQGLKDVDGISVGFVSGTHDPLNSQPPHADYAALEVDRVLKTVAHNQFIGVDVLLSNHWPRDILSDLSITPSGVSMLEQDKVGATIVSQVSSALVPRYHFASNPKTYGYFERPPYKNGPQFPHEKNYHPTRFYGLAPCFNSKGKTNKYLYAFSLRPLRQGVDPTTLYDMSGATPFPFSKLKVPQETKGMKRKAPDSGRFDGGKIDYNKAKPAYAQPGQGRSKRRKHHLTSGARADECWFCMSSSVCEMHLIVSVAKSFYLALAKGPMSETHMLLSPVLHLANGSVLNDEQLKELSEWKEALHKYHASNEMVPVFFEIAPPEGKAKRHMLLQCIPILKDDAGKAAKLFQYEANNEKLDLIQMDKDQQINDVIGSNCPYFWLELPDRTRHVASLEDLRVPFAFGRMVLSKLMGNTRLEDWKRCVPSQKEEERITESLRETFAPFQLSS